MPMGPILAGGGLGGGSTRRMGLVLICDALDAGSIAVNLVSTNFNAVVGFDPAAGVGAAVAVSLALATATNGFSTTGGGGDGGVDPEDDAAGVDAPAVGAVAGVSSLRRLSLSFGLSLASSAAGGTGLAGTAILSAVASAKAEALAVSTSPSTGFPATGEDCDCGARLEDGATGAGAAVVGTAAGGPSRNLSLMMGLAAAGAGEGATGEGASG